MCSSLFQSVRVANFVMIWPEEGVCTSGVPSALTSSVVGVVVPLKRARSVTMVTKHTLFLVIIKIVIFCDCVFY